MTALLLAPHHDDETLFAAYTCLRHKPHVVTCFASHVQASRGGPDHDTRLWETKMALATLGIETHQQLPVRDDVVDEEMLASCLAEVERTSRWTVVFAPAVEDGGHHQHNLVGTLAEQVFGADRLRSYMTYRRGKGRSVSANEVPYEADWPAVKFKAMACHSSQINLPDCRPWFSNWDREWYA